jgi:putative hemolysin
MKRSWSVWIGIALAVLAALGIWYALVHETADEHAQPKYADPASANCIDTLGGRIETTSEAGGFEISYCYLPDGRVCEVKELSRDGACTPPSATGGTSATAGGDSEAAGTSSGDASWQDSGALHAPEGAEAD